MSTSVYHIPRIVKHVARDVCSSYGGAYNTYTYFSAGTTWLEARELMTYPTGKHCKHVGDCCGGWYCHGVESVKSTTGRLCFRQRWYQNV